MTNLKFINTVCFVAALSIFFSIIVFAGGPVTKIKLKINPTKEPDIAVGASYAFTLYDNDNYCSGLGETVVITSYDSPSVGSITATGGLSYTYSNDGTNGYLTTSKDDNKFKFYAACSGGGGADNEEMKPKDSAAGSIPPPPPGPITITASPSGSSTLADNASKSWTVTGVSTLTTPCTPIAYTLVSSPTHGTVTVDASFSSNGQLSYVNDDTGNGYLGTTAENIVVRGSCGPDNADITLRVSTVVATTCSGTSNGGAVIFDNTATPGVKAISANLNFLSGCSKSDTTIDDGYGGNAINIPDWQTVNRLTSNSPHDLELIVGATSTNVDDANFGTSDQLNYFQDGYHLFELDRLRAAADWLSGTTSGVANISPPNTTAVPPGTYGTISFDQFIDNIANGRTMYGLVRIKIALEKGARSCSGADCIKNALGLNVTNVSDIYGFCNVTTNLCSCAPTSGTKIQEGLTICGHLLPSTAKIKVKGALLWDFVDHVTGIAIPLSELPFAPRELYFKVEIPILVNWSHDLDDDGAMDNMAVIKAVTYSGTTALAAGTITPVPDILYSSIPQASKDAYYYETGNALTSTEFATLSNPNKYHLLMASGYADGWADAFAKLGLTTAVWKTLPKSGTCTNSAGSTCSTFGVPAGASTIMVANDIRNSKFEDIPAYLYSGGLIDMHDHVNISGLVYVPQAMELEAKDSSLPTQQYVSGAVLVRDGFFIEAKSNTITVFSADPTSYSTARTSAAVSSNGLAYDPKGPTAPAPPPGPAPSPGPTPPPGDTSCFGCGTSPGGTSSGTTAGVGPVRWIEVRP